MDIEVMVWKAHENVSKWGLQNYETLALCIAEESGEVAQAVLRYKHENGSRPSIRHEAIDLGALCIQLIWAYEEGKT